MGLRKTRKKQGMLAGILSMFGGDQKKSSGKKTASSGKGSPSKGSKDVRSAKSGAPVKKAPPRRPPPVEVPPPMIESFDEELFDAVGIEPAPAPAAPVFKPSAPPAPDYGQGLFPDGVDDSLDALFDSFETGGAPP
ncbi:MAG TPA: hypothetical protein V6C82_03065, partial [Chroococcales cyanobacterium]